MENKRLTISLHIKIDKNTKKIIDQKEKELRVSRSEIVRRAIAMFGKSQADTLSK